MAYVLGHSAARGIVVESQLLTAMRDAIAKVPEVLDVIVAPGIVGNATDHDPRSREPADRAWTTIEALTAHDRAEEPQCFVADRDALSYLYTSGALKTHLAGFKVPKAVVFVDQLPKTSTGKIQKNVVRSEHAARYATSEG